jgi:hypothetical protein
METPGIDVFNEDFIDPHAISQIKDDRDLTVIVRVQDVDKLDIGRLFFVLFKIGQQTQIAQDCFEMVGCAAGLQEGVLFLRHRGQVYVKDIKLRHAFDKFVRERCIGEQLHLEFIAPSMLDDVEKPAVEGWLSSARYTDFFYAEVKTVVEHSADLRKA